MKFLLMLVTVILAATNIAIAHPGKLAKDGCHNDRRVNERHWHIDGNKRGDVCKKRNGKTIKVNKEKMIIITKKEYNNLKENASNKVILSLEEYNELKKNQESKEKKDACWNMYLVYRDAFVFNKDQAMDALIAGRCVVGVELK